jgi:hypothetical protein
VLESTHERPHSDRRERARSGDGWDTHRVRLIDLDHVVQVEPVVLLHAVRRAQAVRVGGPVLFDDDGGLAGAQGPAGVEAIGEADDGADGKAGRGALDGRQELGLQQRGWAS